MAEPSDANKRQKPEDAVPAFSDTISNFAVEETLRFEAGGRLAVVLGTLDGKDCLLELKQRAAKKERAYESSQVAKSNAHNAAGIVREMPIAGGGAASAAAARRRRRAPCPRGARRAAARRYCALPLYESPDHAV